MLGVGGGGGHGSSRKICNLDAFTAFCDTLKIFGDQNEAFAFAYHIVYDYQTWIVDWKYINESRRGSLGKSMTDLDIIPERLYCQKDTGRVWQLQERPSILSRLHSSSTLWILDAFQILLNQQNARKLTCSQSVSLQTEPVVSQIGWGCRRGLGLAEICEWCLHQGSKHSIGQLGFEQDNSICSRLRLLKGSMTTTHTTTLGSWTGFAFPSLWPHMSQTLFLGAFFCLSSSASGRSQWQQMPAQSPGSQCPSDSSVGDDRDQCQWQWERSHHQEYKKQQECECEAESEGSNQVPAHLGVVA